MNTSFRSVSRLSRYRNALCRFKSYGLTWVYSDQIASSLGITAAQVRKDFSQFGVTGKRKSGYHIDNILERLNGILGKNNQTTAIIAGYGTLGKALFKDFLSHEFNLKIAAAFDDAPQETPAAGDGFQVHRLAQLIPFTLKNNINIGIITFTDKTAQNALDLMVLAGIRGILSLSPVELKGPGSCLINTVNILREFENVVYFAGKNGHGKRKVAYG
jgi:redox-sensing transcriptional repressor